MIKFFRKIRLKLLSENKFSKYLLYAAGEIILVVIGILIALQVNNWNIANKTDDLRIEFLTNLKIDLEDDLNRLAYTDKFLVNRKNYSSILLEYFENVPQNFDSIQLILALERSGYAHTFSPPMPTYNEMKGSGNLSLIESKSLKKALANYETFIYNNRSIEERYAYSMTDFSNRAMKYMDPQFGFLDINDTIASAYKGLKFDLNAMANDEHLVTLTKIVHNRSIVEQRYKNDLIKPRIERTLKLVEMELKKINEKN